MRRMTGAGFDFAPTNGLMTLKGDSAKLIFHEG
jgi:hypothetical protein